MSKEESIKVVVIGAGSVIFGPPLLYDLIRNIESRNLVISLVDIDEEKLGLISNAADVIGSVEAAEVEIESSTDRTEVLEEADFVLITVEEDRIERWKLDWEIPKEFGIEHTLGENRGPAGLSHTLRTVPLVLGIAEDVERLAPQASVLVLTNPEDRVAYAVENYTSLKVAGYCDGPWDFKDRYLGTLLGIPGEEIYLEGAGINHAIWLRKIVHRPTGKDLYPDLLQKASRKDWQPFGQHLYKTYGFWPHENDEHYGEYFNYACDYIDCNGYDFAAHLEKAENWKAMLEALEKEEYREEDFVRNVADLYWKVFGDSPPSDVIRGVSCGEERFLPGIDITNDGKIPGLPEDMIVEVPAVATPGGISGIKWEAFPDELTSFLYREAVIQRLSAEAAAEGSRNKALKALLLDSHIDDPRTARNLLEEFISVHEDYFPELT